MMRTLSPRKMNRLVSHQRRLETRLSHGGLSVSYSDMPDFWAEMSLSEVQTKQGPDAQETQHQTVRLKLSHLPEINRSDRLIIDALSYSVTSLYTDEDGFGIILAKRQLS